MITDPLQLFKAEMFLADCLKKHGVTIFHGPTDMVLRKERIRAAIIDHGIAARNVKKADGTMETYEKNFARIYGEPLIQQGKSEAA